MNIKSDKRFLEKVSELKALGIKNIRKSWVTIHNGQIQLMDSTLYELDDHPPTPECTRYGKPFFTLRAFDGKDWKLYIVAPPWIPDDKADSFIGQIKGVSYSRSDEEKVTDEISWMEHLLSSGKLNPSGTQDVLEALSRYKKLIAKVSDSNGYVADSMWTIIWESMQIGQLSISGTKHKVFELAKKGLPMVHRQKSTRGSRRGWTARAQEIFKERPHIKARAMLEILNDENYLYYENYGDAIDCYDDPERVNGETKLIPKEDFVKRISNQRVLFRKLNKKTGG